MKEFTEPMVEVVELVDDVIAANSGCPMDCPDDCPGVCENFCTPLKY